MNVEFSDEELALIKKLGLTVPKQPEYKILKLNLTCKLCGTVTSQFFRLVKVPNMSGITWIKDKRLDPAEVNLNNKIEESNLTTSICSACEETLMKEPKLKLVRMLMDLSSFNAPKASKYEIQNKEYKLRQRQIEKEYKNERNSGSLV